MVALAIFELGTVVSKEYGNNEDSHIVIVLRRTLPRFISIVCIALALEGLLMVIKYSQLDMAGNLYYPVAIIIATSTLIIALGIFLRFTNFGNEIQSISESWEVLGSQQPDEKAVHDEMQYGQFGYCSSKA